MSHDQVQGRKFTHNMNLNWAKVSTFCVMISATKPQKSDTLFPIPHLAKRFDFLE